MSNPARILHKAMQLLPKGAFQRLALRREQWIKQFPHDKETSWWVDEPLIQAAADESRQLYNQSLKKFESEHARERWPHEQRPQDMQIAMAFPILAQWRLTRGVYEFDETLSESLAETDIDKIPIQALKRMPEYAPYLRLNFRYAEKRIIGVWFSMALDKDLKPALIKGIFHTEDDEIMVWGLILDEDKTLDECISKTLDNTYTDHEDLKEVAKLHSDKDKRMFDYMLSHLLYLCSKEPDIQGTPHPIKYNKKKNLSHIPIPEQKDNMLMVGYKHGGVIRMWQENVGNTHQSDTSGLGMPKAPHLRKAHWHLYWTGKGRTVPILHWIPPTAVNVKDIDEVATHMRPVQDNPADAK